MNSRVQEQEPIPDKIQALRWGVLGVANIATKTVIPAIQQSRFGRVVAIASRELANAQRASEKLEIDTAYESYDALLADMSIDAVYIPLPNHLHVPWTIKAMQSGKHVLCEKPIAMTAAEADTLRSVQNATGMQCCEAFMVRSHPRWHAVRELIASHRIGPLRLVHGHFSYYRVNPDDVRSRKEWGGGVLMDIGCYPIMLARWLFASEPTKVLGAMEIDPVFGVDRLFSAILQFPNGRATFNCGGQLFAHQALHCFGSAGRIHIDVPFSPANDVPSTIRVYDGSTLAGPGETITFDPVNQYTLQVDNFAMAVRGLARMPISLDDSIANMRVIDGLRRSAESGVWEQIERGL